MKLGRDILKQGGRYSQGRIYLFISFVSFIVLNGVLAYCAVAGIQLEDMETLLLVSTNIKWALGTFSLYTLGGKGIGAFRDRDTGVSNDYQHQQADHHFNPYGGHWNHSDHTDHSNHTDQSNGFGDDEEEIN